MGIHDRINPFSNVIQLPDLRPSMNQGLSSDNEVYTSDDNGSLLSAPLQTDFHRGRGRRPLMSPIRIENYCHNKRIERRINMMNTLRELVGIAELDEDREIIPRRASAFYELFSDHEKMQIWNEFVELNEDDQNSFLNETARPRTKEVKSEVVEELEEVECDSSDEFVVVKPCRKDKRAVHPSYSSVECFQRIQPGLRSRLKRGAPYGVMERLELDIRKCFTECSYTVYDSEMETSVGRLVAHVIAQYLGLETFTMDSKEGRKVKVVNKRDDFSPPPELLSRVLELRLYRREQ